MVVLVHVLALIAALSLANGGCTKQPPVAGPIAFDIFLPSGG
jgi:hypothetical protein